LPELPLLDGFGLTFENNLDIFRPEKGPPITGPLMADAGETVIMRFAMDAALAGYFRQWWMTQTKGGAVPFQYRLPLTGEVHRFQLAEGQKVSIEPAGSGVDLTVSLPLLRLP
jgi:hypothetical protein